MAYRVISQCELQEVLSVPNKSATFGLQAMQRPQASALFCLTSKTIYNCVMNARGLFCDAQDNPAWQDRTCATNTKQCMLENVTIILVVTKHQHYHAKVTCPPWRQWCNGFITRFKHILVEHDSWPTFHQRSTAYMLVLSAPCCEPQKADHSTLECSHPSRQSHESRLLLHHQTHLSNPYTATLSLSR